MQTTNVSATVEMEVEIAVPDDKLDVADDYIAAMITDHINPSDVQGVTAVNQDG